MELPAKSRGKIKILVMKKIFLLMAIGTFTVAVAKPANINAVIGGDEQICSASAMAAGDAAEANGADSLQAFEIANATYEACMGL